MTKKDKDKNTESKKGKKTKAIEKLFASCQRKGNYVFDNDDVKRAIKQLGFKNPFDVTKIDQSKKLPQAVREEDYFIAHLGKGRHQFVKGIQYGYHQFETPQQQKNWDYRRSLLNEVDSSESNILSLCANQFITHDFLYQDITAKPKVYGGRRTFCTMNYKAGSTALQLERMQMEIDMTMENDGVVTIFEAKNDFHDDFSVYQLFHPFLYYHQLKQKQNIAIKDVNCCYLLREDKKLRVYLYTFADLAQIESIKLLKSCEYRMVER